MFITVLADSN